MPEPMPCDEMMRRLRLRAENYRWGVVGAPTEHLRKVYEADATAIEQAIRMLEERQGYTEAQVRQTVTDTLSAVDAKGNGWSKVAREAVHEGMWLFLHRLEEVPPNA